MQSTIARIKKKTAALFNRFRAWLLAFLIAIGLIALPVLAGTIQFTWTNAIERADGTPFDAATEQAEIRLYCNGDTSPTFISPGAATATAEIIVAAGEYTCYATTVDMDGQESDPSNIVTKTVLAAIPAPPTLTN